MLVYTWHLGSRWYTSDLNVDNIDMQAFVPPWHEGLYLVVEEVCQTFAARSWQLASCRHLLQIACHPSAPWGVWRDGNHRASHCPLDVRVWQGVHGHTSQQSVPSFFHLLWPLRSAWQASSLQWMPACSKFCCAAHIGHIHGQVRLPEEGIDALWPYFVHTYHPHTDLNFLKTRLNIIPAPMLSPICATFSNHLIFLDFITWTILGEYRSLS
jgi:hypothetical protein